MDDNKRYVLESFLYYDSKQRMEVWKRREYYDQLGCALGKLENNCRIVDKATMMEVTRRMI